MVGFRDIPAALRVPLFFAELDNSQGNTGSEAQRTLVIGQMTAAGTLPAGLPVIDQGAEWRRGAAGAGSELARMAAAYRRRDSFGELHLLPLADAGAGVAATGSVAFTTAATAAGTLNLYVGGERVQMLVVPSQTPAQLATALAAAITAQPDLPVTAAAATSTVTLTAKNKGLNGNQLPLMLNYRGAAGGEATPAGLGVTLTQMTGGTTNPALDAALANLGDRTFDFIVCPFTDSASLASIRAFLAARWAWDRMLYGHAFAATAGTLGDATTFGLAQNDPHLTVMPAHDSPTPPAIWAANLVGALAVSLRADPGLPLHGLPLDVLPPPAEKRFTIGERNVLLFDGMSTHTVADDGTVTTETIITTYQRNAAGVADDSQLYVERMFVVMAVIRDLRAFVTTTFGRMKLADDGTGARPGSRIVTPSIIRDALLGRYRFLERQGLVQDYEAFAAALDVQRNASNRCRVDGLIPIVPIDQLRQFAAVVQPRNSSQGT
ncbi:phage tail sheath subtilisin-like domain-containing protein [Teichococcus aestuarii]|uniref:phage tail sheath subtilisin-like domain-containing protein n=2 Tax=Teichococcus aestuarii TaxID=568898 RepID=UPI00360AFBCA